MKTFEERFESFIKTLRNQLEWYWEDEHTEELYLLVRELFAPEDSEQQDINKYLKEKKRKEYLEEIEHLNFLIEELDK